MRPDTVHFYQVLQEIALDLIPTDCERLSESPFLFGSILNFITHSDIDRVSRRYSDKVSSLRERAFELCVDVRSASTKYH